MTVTRRIRMTQKALSKAKGSKSERLAGKLAYLVGIPAGTRFLKYQQMGISGYRG
jgi:hypothetical protein